MLFSSFLDLFFYEVTMEHNIFVLLEKKRFLDTEREKTYKKYLRILAELVNVELDISSIQNGEYDYMFNPDMESQNVLTKQDNNS